MNKKCIYFSRFEPITNADGGCRRLAQLNQALSTIDIDLISLSKDWSKIKFSIFTKGFNYLKSKIKMLDLMDKYFVTNCEYKLWHEEHRNNVYFFKRISRQWTTRLIKKQTNMKLALVDDPIYFAPLVKILKKQDIPIVAICNNIETLCPAQIAKKQQRILFNKELDILSKCNLVVTISREETFLLNNLNINTVYFPYYPVDNIVARMLNIRKNRKNTIKKDIILIGTAYNKPTKHGMISIIKAWKDHGFARTGSRLLIAGYGTDILKNIVHGSGLEFLGTLSNENLDKILSGVKVCLSYQENGSGALTRIPEMPIAGVPVLANSHAARSYYNIKGILEFSCFEDLEQAFLKIESVEEDIPIPTPPDSSFLISALTKYV